jgi:hypothetical protein
MPMCLLEFRFTDRAPTPEALSAKLGDQLGTRSQRLDELEVRGDRVRALSQHVVALLYFAKICQELGGVSVRPDGSEPGRIPIPGWAQIPWRQHGLLKRLSIRLGRISLRRVPIGDG